MTDRNDRIDRAAQEASDQFAGHKDEWNARVGDVHAAFERFAAALKEPKPLKAKYVVGNEEYPTYELAFRAAAISGQIMFVTPDQKPKTVQGDPDFDVDEDPKKLPPPRCSDCGLEKWKCKTHTEDGELKFICESCVQERERKEKEKIFVRYPNGNIWYMEAYNSMGELRPWIGGKDDKFHKGSRPMTIREAYRPGAVARYVYEDPKDYLEGLVQASDGEELLMGGLWRGIKNCTLVKPAPEEK
ncbi:hypothetical protein LCGC14_1347060 [marine sediment metagenome]|uniref:Uncharacterized protein n=1 Tax=marine sediment metagenome TaxID=412755 RepID=A0A0F9KC17_9ZZZZ